MKEARKNVNGFTVKLWRGKEKYCFLFSEGSFWDDTSRELKDATLCSFNYKDLLVNKGHLISTMAIRNPKDKPDTYTGQKVALRRLLNAIHNLYTEEDLQIIWKKFFSLWGRDERGEKVEK